MFEEVEPAGLEFVADKPEAEHPALESVFLIIRFGFPCRGFLLREDLMGDDQAELYVCLDFSGVECPVEKPELDGPFGEGGMQVQTVIAGAVIMIIPSVGCFLIQRSAIPSRVFSFFRLSSFRKVEFVFRQYRLSREGLIWRAR